MKRVTFLARGILRRRKNALTSKNKKVPTFLCEEPEREYAIPADVVILATGFSGPAVSVLEAFGVDRDLRGNVMADTEGETRFKTSIEKVLAAEDVWRGQSLVVWALHERRECADAVDRFMMQEAVLTN